MSAGGQSALRSTSGKRLRVTSRRPSTRSESGRKEYRQSQQSKKIAETDTGGGDARQNIPVRYPVQNTFDQLGAKSDVEAASKSVEELRISKPSRTAVSQPSNSEGQDSARLGKKKMGNPESLTPTVVLNGLAMARGEKVSYKVVKKIPLPCQPIYKTEFCEEIDYPSWTDMYFYHHGFDGGYYGGQRSMYFKKPVKRWIYPCIFHVEVTVGDRSFTGEGKSQQAARHSAAQHALDVLQTMPVPKITKKGKGDQKTKNNKSDNADARCGTVAKSPISLLYEKASGYRLKVNFEIVNEEGPPHLKYFTVMATVFKTPSEVIVTGEGKGTNKNAAKTKAANVAFEKLKTISLPEKNTTKKRVPQSADIKVAAVLSSSVVLHPCSRLNQILQVKHEKIPTYAMLPSEDNAPTESKFVIQCSAMDQTATGQGRNKKEARRNAAENLLKVLGFYSPATKAETSDTAEPTTRKSLTQQRTKRVTRDVLPPLMEVNFEMQV